ncbi:MAG: hypothetical protein GY847_12635 [Proteobacteria bacterium]|nr:hypothetical protein [Pseudomonadota bacterium]
MIYSFIGSVLPVLVGTSAATAFLWVAHDQNHLKRLLEQYSSWWIRTLAFSRGNPRMKSLPNCQVAAVLFLSAAAVILGQILFLALASISAFLPPWLLVRYRNKRIQTLEIGLDAFLTSLADSLTTVPNLTEALHTLLEHTEPPIREEVAAVLAEVKLGRSLDDALRQMAGRLALPGLDAAVGAALLGKRTGGDLPIILRRIAETLREMSRLEGVIRTKTAEGRSQAWVMGIMPPGLMLVLEKVDPNWLAPLWSDPIGWIMLGVAAALEVCAVALIRKIMAVDI